MSRAEDLARQKYPNDEPIDCVRCHVGVYKREGFVAGYHQAEEDLALTAEDIREIFSLFSVVAIDLADSLHTNEDIYKEILRRFNELKK